MGVNEAVPATLPLVTASFSLGQLGICVLRSVRVRDLRHWIAFV